MTEQRLPRRRYLGIAGALGTVGLAGCVTASSPLSQGVDEATRERYVGVATRVATDLEEWRRRRSGTTRRLAQSDAARNGTAAEQYDWLEFEGERLPADVYRINIVDPNDWTVVASSDPAKQGEPLNTREAPWQTDRLEYGSDDVFVSRADEALARSLVSFVAPVDTDDDRQRRLVMQTSLDELAATFQRPSRGVYSQIVDADGRIVAGTRPIQRLERNDGTLRTYPGGTDATAVQQALGGASGFVAEPAINESDQGGGDADSYVVAYAGVENRAWAVLTHVPQQTMQNG